MCKLTRQNRGLSDHVCCLEKGLHWIKLLSLSSWFFRIVFSVDTESLNHDAFSICVPRCVSACAKIFILSLTVMDLCCPLLYMFCLVAPKFFVVHWKIKLFKMRALLLNVSLMKIQSSLCWNDYSLLHLSDMGEWKCTCWVTVILRHIRFKVGLVRANCLDCHWKNPVTCARP
jgi:hypothetical protein